MANFAYCECPKCGTIIMTVSQGAAGDTVQEYLRCPCGWHEEITFDEYVAERETTV